MVINHVRRLERQPARDLPVEIQKKSEESKHLRLVQNSGRKDIANTLLEGSRRCQKMVEILGANLIVCSATLPDAPPRLVEHHQVQIDLREPVAQKCNPVFNDAFHWLVVIRVFSRDCGQPGFNQVLI